MYQFILKSSFFLAFIFFQTHCFAEPFELSSRNISSYISIDVSLLNQSQDILYNIQNQSGNGIETMQTYRLSDDLQYELVDEIHLGSRFEYDSVNAHYLTRKGQRIYAIGRTAYAVFQIDGDQSLTLIERFDLEPNVSFASNVIELTDGYVLTKSQDSLSVWSLTEEDLKFSFKFIFEQDYPNNNDSWVFNEESMVLRTASFSQTSLVITEYLVDLVDFEIIELQEQSISLPDVIDPSIQIFASNPNYDNFFIKNQSVELFVGINQDGQYYLLLNTPISSGSITDYNKKNKYLESIYENGVNQQYLSTVNWENLSIKRNLISLPTLPYTDFNGDGQTEQIGVVGFVSENVASVSHRYEHGVFSLHDMSDVVEIEGKFLSRGSFDTLPTMVNKQHYDKDLKRLVLTGNINNVNKFGFFVWQYSPDTNNFQFVAQSELGLNEQGTNSLNVGIIAQKGTDILLSVVNYDTNTLQLLSVSILNNQISINQTKTIALDEEAQSFRQIFLVDTKTIGIRQHNLDKVILTLCYLNEINQITNCETIKSIANLQIPSSYTYDFIPFNTEGEFLFAASSSINPFDDIPPSYYILKYNNEIKNFDLIQTITLPESESIFYDGVNDIFVSNDGLNMYWMQQTINHYSYSNNQWLASGDITYNETRDLVANKDGDFFIDRDGYKLKVLDPIEHRFYQAEYFNGLEINNAWFELTENDQGFYVGGTSRTELSTFTITDSKPPVYKGNLTYYKTDIKQDENVALNFDEYFINADKIIVTGLPDSLIWEGSNITGSLSNKDMFFSDDLSDPRPANDIRVEFFEKDSDVSPIAYFDIVPINVNDKPILVADIEKQYLEINQFYSGDIASLVFDPDRESLFFAFSNMPKGMTGSSDGYIEGRIASSGTYTIGVTASDILGEKLTFNIVIEIKKSSEAAQSSSGGGGLGLTFFSLLFLIVFKRVKR